MCHTQAMTEPWWHRWLLSDRPGVRQFALGAVAMLLPLPAVFFGPDQIIPAMAVGIAIGVGLGVGWVLLFVRIWMRTAPVAALGVYLMCFGCLFHVEVMPRWELILRLLDTKHSIERWGLEREAGRVSPPPMYRSGEGRSQCQIHSDARGEVVFTPVPLQRWSWSGWRGTSYLILRGKGEVITVWNETDLQQVLSGH